MRISLLPLRCRVCLWLPRTEGALNLSHHDGDTNLAPWRKPGGQPPRKRLATEPRSAGWIASPARISPEGHGEAFGEDGQVS